jgi:hypothetical protein
MADKFERRDQVSILVNRWPKVLDTEAVAIAARELGLRGA